MRHLILSAALILAAAAGASAEGKVKAKTPGQAVREYLVVKGPAGWSAEEYSNAEGADPVVRFQSLSDAVVIRLYGAPGSDYPKAESFMAGPGATEAGAAPVDAGSVVVAGKKLALLKRRFPIVQADPHRPTPGRSLMGTELYCLLPLKDGRYAVLAYRRETPVPDMDRKGEKAWEAFLKTVRPKMK